MRILDRFRPTSNRNDAAGGNLVQVYGMLLDPATRKDLNAAIVSVVFGMIFVVITGYPGASPLFTAFLKNELGISNRAYGLILVLPYLTVLIQIPFSYYVARHGHIKQAFLLALTLSRLMFLVPAALPLFAGNLTADGSVLVIGGFMLLASFFSWIGESALSTWYGAMIPGEIKGRYFSTRQMIYTLAMLVYALVLSYILKVIPDFPWKYSLFFAVATFFGVTDIAVYLRARPPEKAYNAYDPTLTVHNQPGLGRFIEPLRDRTYRNFLLFAISWSFSLNLAGPYFNVYMLQTLKVPLSQQTIIQQIIPAIATVLFLRKIGHIYDTRGFRLLLLLSCLVVSFLPILWMLATPETYWFVGISNFLGGIFAAAVEMALVTLAIFLAPHQQRNAYLAVKTILVSWLGIVPAILLGGQLSDWLTDILAVRSLPFFAGQILQPFHVLLILSIFLRLASALFFARRLRV